MSIRDGDIFQVQIENGKINLLPMKLIPAAQAWFLTKEWQEGEKEADENIADGKVKSFENTVDFLGDLDK